MIFFPTGGINSTDEARKTRLFTIQRAIRSIQDGVVVFIAHRIREAMRMGELASMGGGGGLRRG